MPVNCNLSTRDARTIACVLFNVTALFMLYPGLTRPLLTVIVKFNHFEILRQTRSTLGTIWYLREEGAYLPSALILIFSVLVPIIKFIVLLLVALAPRLAWRRHLYLFVRNWSKWSMADVFVTAIFVAFLSANAKSATMEGQVGAGFYFFLSYCLLSLIALQVMPKPALSAWQKAGVDEAELAASSAQDDVEVGDVSHSEVQAHRLAAIMMSPQTKHSCGEGHARQHNIDDESSQLHEREDRQEDAEVQHSHSHHEPALTQPDPPSKSASPDFSSLKEREWKA